MSRLFYLPLGEWEVISPKPGETIEGLYKRLSRLARSYRRWERAFRVEKQADGVLWWRVQPGEQTKLARWYRLPVGEPLVLKPNAGPPDLGSAKATARYLRRKGKGAFEAYLQGTDLVVCRTSVSGPAEPTCDA